MDTFPICFVQISCFRSSDMTSWCLHAENSLFSHRVTGQECRFLGFWTQAVSALCILCLWLSHSSFRHLSLSQSLLVYLSLTHCQHSLSDMRFMFWEFDGELCAQMPLKGMSVLCVCFLQCVVGMLQQHRFLSCFICLPLCAVRHQACVSLQPPFMMVKWSCSNQLVD